MCGIAVGAIIATKGALMPTITLIGTRTLDIFRQPDNIYLYLFLFALGILISLLNRTGGAIAFARKFTQLIEKKASGETSAILLSYILSIDDYLSILTTGYVMRPIVDHLGIAREKLAFLIHSLSGSVVILVPISSWFAAITVYLEQVGVSIHPGPGTKILADPFFVHLQTIPFLFYSVLISTCVWVIARGHLSFGPMYYYETQTIRRHASDLMHLNPALRGTATDLFVPLITLLLGIFLGIPYAGDYYLFGGTHSFLEAFQQNGSTFLVMCCAGIAAVIVGMLFATMRKVITIYELPSITRSGISLMYPAILMVVLASILGALLKTDLQTGVYIASNLLDNVPLSILPVSFFVVSLITALFTGSSWGTFALMLSIGVPMLDALLPEITPMLPHQVPLLYPILGAIFSGAVCGDHISPISETTIMAATSAGTDPIIHAATQFPYALPAIIGSACAFIVAGLLMHTTLWINALSSLAIGITITVGLLYVFQYRWNRKQNR